ncbi:MAG: hypothetical protein GY937_01660 [bacterium]|nr:hypothetical protein [bacterium]
MGSSTNGRGPREVRLSRAARAGLMGMVAVLSMPVITAPFSDGEERARMEKRELAAFPVWRGPLEAPNYFAAVGDYLDDHVGFAFAANRLLRQVMFYGFGDDPVDDVRAGTQGFVYLNDGIEALCAPETEDARSDELAGKIDRVFGWLEARGYRVSLGVAVTKPGLYPEHLPQKVSAGTRAACEAYAASPIRPRLEAGIEPSSGRVFHYPFAEFMQRRNERAFFPKENFHWNGMSTHVFARGLLEKMGVPVSAEFGAGAQRIEARADLVMMGFFRRIEVWDFPYAAQGLDYHPRNPEVVREYYERARGFSTWNSTDPLSDRSALLLTDSFGKPLARHLAPGFKKLVHVNLNHLQPREWKGFFTSFLDQLEFSDVIFLSHDSGLATTRMFDGIASIEVEDQGAASNTPQGGL